MTKAALSLLWLPMLTGATLKVASPTSLDWTAVATSAGMPEKVSGTIFVVLDSGAEPLAWEYIDSKGFQQTGTATLLGPPPTGASLGVPRPFRVEVSLKSAKLPSQGYLIVKPKTGEPVTVPLKINAPEKSAELIRADSAKRVDGVMKCGILGAMAIVGLATVLVVRKLGFQVLNLEMGTASWEFGSWATNTTVTASVLTAMVGLPAAGGWTKFEWGRNYGLIAAGAAFLVLIAPTVYNLARVPRVAGGGVLLYSGRVWIFLVMSVLTTWGATSQWLVAWLAVRELEAKRLISGDSLAAIELILSGFALALLWYIVRSIPVTIEAQTNGDEPLAKLSASSTRTAHPQQSYLRLL